MASESVNSPVSRKVLWAGWLLSVLPVLMLTMSGVMKIAKPPDVVEGFTHLGWPVSLALALSVVELGSAALYVVPRTAVLGAILLTGYLGGAIATHVRIGEHSQIAIPIALGVMIWLGLYLRDVRLRALLPLRT